MPSFLSLTWRPDRGLNNPMLPIASPCLTKRVDGRAAAESRGQCRTLLLPVLLLAACNHPAPLSREGVTHSCIYNGADPGRCVDAGRRAFPSGRDHRP